MTISHPISVSMVNNLIPRLCSRAGNGVALLEMRSQGCIKKLLHSIAGILYGSGYAGLG